MQNQQSLIPGIFFTKYEVEFTSVGSNRTKGREEEKDFKRLTSEITPLTVKLKKRFPNGCIKESFTLSNTLTKYSIVLGQIGCFRTIAIVKKYF